MRIVFFSRIFKYPFFNCYQSTFNFQAEEQKKKIDSIEAEMAQLKSRPTPAGQLASAAMAGKIPPGGVSKQEHEAALNQLRQQLDAANKEKEVGLLFL